LFLFSFLSEGFSFGFSFLSSSLLSSGFVGFPAASMFKLIFSVTSTVSDPAVMRKFEYEIASLTSPNVASDFTLKSIFNPIKN